MLAITICGTFIFFKKRNILYSSNVVLMLFIKTEFLKSNLD